MNSEFEVKTPAYSRRKIIGLATLLVVAGAIATGVYFYIKISRPASFNSNPVTFTVERGSSAQQIADQLGQEGIVRSPRVFTVYVYLTGSASKIQAGQYLLDRRMTMEEILSVLTAGQVQLSDQRVTVIEGWTNRQIATNLAQKNIVSAEDFNAALGQNYDFRFDQDAHAFRYEGFLFPDTYSLRADQDAADLIQQMLTNFENKLPADLLADLERKNLDIGDVVIIASIVEKEVGRNKDRITSDDVEAMNEERRLVASVFYNRLEIGMALQSDATVNYVTGGGRRRATADDIAIDSPYNTYRVGGLPPGPISNPGLESIRAAINPADSDYLYFINKIDGEAVFARTLDEHNRNIAEYLD